MALTRKLIQVSFTLGTQLASGVTAGPQSFGPDGSDTVTLKELRVIASVKNAGQPSQSTLTMQVYGMKLETMNKLATLGLVQQQIRRNFVTVLAGEEGSPLSQIFKGTILQAWADFQNMPEVAFHVEAQVGAFEQVVAATPISINGSADVVELMKGLASQMGLSFENNGISNNKIASPYLYGAPIEQASMVARAAGINWFIDGDVLAIWPRNGSRGGTIPLVSPDTGLVGYPNFTSYGIALKTLFNPQIRANAEIKVETSLENVATLNGNGIWTVYSLDHELESISPHGGRWFSNMLCYNKKFPPAVTPR
jgi:hypothetical protein